MESISMRTAVDDLARLQQGAHAVKIWKWLLLWRCPGRRWRILLYLWGKALVVLVPVDGRGILWEGWGLVVVTLTRCQQRFDEHLT